jgi:transposase-like protein
MRLIDVHREFNTDDKCLDYLERMRWPNGLACIKCGSVKVSRIVREKPSKNKRVRIYQCLEPECKHQFSPTAGTIFHDSHLSLQKWFLAIALICEAKKSISANQLARHLGVNYRTAWHLAHRIREAMKDGGLPLTGEVETDETYIGPKVPRKGRPYPKRKKKDVVLGIVERHGKVRLLPVADATRHTLQPVLEQHIGDDVSVIYTDEHPTYIYALPDKFPGKHRMIAHAYSYAVGHTHTNTVENAFSLFKRTLMGSFHHISIKHLRRYCDEFSYRFNRRDEQPIMFAQTVRRMLEGKALSYKRLTTSSISDF